MSIVELSFLSPTHAYFSMKVQLQRLFEHWRNTWEVEYCVCPGRQAVIIRVINKLDSRFAVVRFCWQRRAQQKYGEKLGRERHPVVSQKWLSSHCIEPSTLYLSLNIITSVLLRSPSPLNFWFHRPRNYILWELYNKRKQRIVIDTASNL